jgi:hypothetical protein
MTLTFSFPWESSMKEYKNLTTLHNVEIDLTGASCEVEIEINGDKKVINPLSGRLFFKRTQLLRIDDKEDRVILSGIFDMSFLRNDIPESIYDGRFDLGINKDFYSFED